MAQRMSIHKEVHQLADEMGDFTVFWGFKKVHGRIWTHLILSDDALDASDLIQRLGISKALASMSLGELIAMEIIEEHGKSGRGTQLYRANPEILNVILSIIKVREREMLARIQKAVRDVKRLPVQKRKKCGLSSANIHALNNLVGIAQQALDSFLKNLNFDLSAAKKFPLTQPKVRRVALRH
jgi:DNA-binding transcriptional regulator GbsR (MarR family)